jgi:hypothetical protein
MQSGIGIGLIKLFMYNFTFARFLAAFITIVVIAFIKYSISGNFYLDLSDFWGNVATGLLAWTINNGIFNIFTEYLGIKGINFNLHNLFYGFDKIKVNVISHTENNKSFVKLSNTNSVVFDDDESTSNSNSVKAEDYNNHSDEEKYSCPYPPNSPSPILNSHYWKEQLWLYERALDIKNRIILTEDHEHARDQLMLIGEYNKKQIEEGIVDIKRNIRECLVEESDKRRSKVLSQILASSREMKTENERLILSSIKDKLMGIAEHNRTHGTQYTMGFRYLSEDYRLTIAEREFLRKKILEDPNALDVLKRQAGPEDILFRRAVFTNSNLVKYLEEVTKK